MFAWVDLRQVSSRRISSVAAAGLAVCALIFPLAGQAQRLPGGVLPRHYSLTLAPNLQTATFTGKETIDIVLARPSDAITLNAAEIEFGKVTAQAGTKTGGKTLTARVSLDPAKEQATLHFPAALPAGPATLAIAYRGILNNELRGFYLSKTARRNYAVTQFEPTDARRAFPSFDEPADKAAFDISLIVARGDTAISNTNVVSDTPGPGAGEHTVRFAETPRMSTYLVAFLVGDFQCLSGQSDEVPIRVCATPDKVQYGAFALAGAEFFLHYYDTYFGIKYPMPKLDMIALPDFEAGAMENFGAITYRETALLVNPKTASLDAEKLVAVDVAHEMSHQWFGDMVTMNWWDNLWLNEGFATWMENKAAAAWKPEWNIPQDVAFDRNTTLDLDAQGVTRTIHAPAETPDEINEMFDGITYGKAGAVLLMVENYLGEETFRQGVHRYLQAHMYGNATAEDFWNAQTRTSGKPVDRIMESLVEQPGEPLLTFGAARNGKVQVMQRRFFLNARKALSDQQSGTQTWTLPVCLKTTGGAPDCQVLSGSAGTLQVPPGPVLYGDAGGKGYYRSRYDAGDYQKLLGRVETYLQPPERISLVGGEWALTRAEQAPAGDFLRLAATVKDDPSADVIDTVSSALGGIDRRLASTPAEHARLAAWVRKTFAPARQRLGAPAAGELPEKKELRASLFGLLGSIGEDPEVAAQSRRIAGQYLQDPSSVDATLAGVALQVAALHGDRAFFDQLQTVSETANNPQLQSQTLDALALFRDPALVKRTLDYAVSGRVKNQNSTLLIARELGGRDTQDLAWQYVRQNWPRVRAQLTTMMGGYLVESTGSFCSVERRREVAAFFLAHPVPAAARSLTRAEDSIDDCVELRAAQGANLERWLSTEAGGL